MTDYPLAKTAAAQMLAHGLRTAATERHISLREIGRRLGYRQPVVLSHMATGRTPIPVDRAPEIAAEVGLPAKAFLEAVLQQRHPNVDWQLITGTADPFATELERTAGKPLSQLSLAHQRVLRDVVRDSHPEERWLAIPEISAMKFLRQLFPKVTSEGLTDEDREVLRLALLFNQAEEKGEE